MGPVSKGTTHFIGKISDGQLPRRKFVGRLAEWTRLEPVPAGVTEGLVTREHNPNV